MKLSEYVAEEVERRNKKKKKADAPITKTAFLRELSDKCSVSLLTLQGVERGATMRRYDKAKAVSESTGGKVTVQDLCEEHGS